MNAKRRRVITAAAAFIIIARVIKRKRRPRKLKRRFWVREWISRRAHLGAHVSLLPELRQEDPESYRNFLRLDDNAFQELLGEVHDAIYKRDTNMRESIKPDQRLSVTLRYLASGNSYIDMSYLYRIPPQTLCKIIPETCAAIYDALSKKYLKVPQTRDDWKLIAENFEKQWNFPHCIGALDGKHIAIVHPPNTGAKFYNYKLHFSIVLLALVDANYKFLFIDVGCNGRVSDGGVLRNSDLGQALEEGTLNLPNPEPLQGHGPEFEAPYVIVADDAFPLKENIMKPFPGKSLNEPKRIFNYRLSRARRVSENAFGILVSRFRIFDKTINLPPGKAEIITLACCALHNFLACKKSNYAVPSDEEIAAGGNLDPLQQQQGPNRSNKSATDIRDELCKYVNTTAPVPWQYDLS